MSRIPNYYRPPHSLPLYWRDEQSGVLADAVNAYLDAAVCATSMTDKQIELLRDYFSHYINAPCWTELDGELAKLREEVARLKTFEELNEWVSRCLDVGLAPL